MLNKYNQKEYIQFMIKNNLFAVVFPEQKTFRAAAQIAPYIDSAAGVAKFEEDNGEIVWGILIDKVKSNQEYKDLLKKENKK